MKICYFGTYEENYSRNQIMIKALKAAKIDVVECHISLWRGKRDKSNALKGISNKLKLSLHLLTIYPRLILKYIFMESHHIIFVGYFGHLDMFIAKLLTVFNKKPIIFDAFISLYDSIVKDRKMVREGSLLSKLSFMLDKYSCNLADIVILDTQQHINYFIKEFKLPENKFRRVFACADDSVFRPIKKEKQQNGSFNVLFYGKFTPLHGIEYIIDAAELLKQDNKIKFTVIGKGQVYEEILRKILNKKLDNIEMIPWVEYAELPEYINRSDVCLGIFNDSEKALRVIPNKVFQTLAMGKPVVTADSLAVRELLKDGENAILCPPADGKSLAMVLQGLKKDENLRRNIGNNGYRIFQERCTMNVVGNEISSIVKETIKNNS